MLVENSKKSLLGKDSRGRRENKIETETTAEGEERMQLSGEGNNERYKYCCMW